MYEKQNFSDGSVLTAEQLNHMETGIVEAHDALPKKLTKPETAKVGDYLRVKAVNDDGSMDLEAVELPVGEDSGENAARAAYFLELSEDEADAQANSDAITKAVAEYKHVILKMGDYPVEVGIVVDSGVLDLNNSRLYDLPGSTGSIIKMVGERPIVCNGDIEGCYNVAHNDPAYVWREDEQCLWVAGVNDALVSNMTLHNAWGAGLVTNHVSGERVTITADDATQINTGSGMCEFETPALDIPEGYAYVSAVGNYGYNRIISVGDARYIFLGDDEVTITTVHATPRIRVAIPDGAKKVKISTICKNTTFVPYFVFFTNYRENITVENTLFRHCNQGGWNNPCGPSIIRNCGFLDIGKPYPACPTSTLSGGWGIDIEDQPCPEFIMSDCWSSGCKYMLIFGGYNGTVTNCQGDSIGAYTGQNLMISNCKTTRLYTSGGGTYNIWTHGVHAGRLDIDAECESQIHGDISTNTLSSCLDRFDDFTVNVTSPTVVHQTVTGILHGTIAAETAAGTGSRGIIPKKGSRLRIVTPGCGDSSSGAFKAQGDSYGLESDAPWIPCGYTIRDSVFTVQEQKCFWNDTGIESSGVFENCEFNLAVPYFDDYDSVLAPATQPTELTFRDCNINNDGVYLFNYKLLDGSVITFERCTVSDPEHIVVDLTGVTIRFLDYSPEDYTVLKDGGSGHDYNVVVKDGALVAIARAVNITVTTQPTKLDYTIGDALDLSGMLITLTRQDGTAEEITDYTAPAELPRDGIVIISYTEFGGTYTATVQLNVAIPAESIALDKSELSVAVGSTATLVATVTPADSTDAVAWTSDAEGVATVANGIVTAVAEGTANITATCGGHSAVCAVTVTAAS